MKVLKSQTEAIHGVENQSFVDVIGNIDNTLSPTIEVGLSEQAVKVATPATAGTTEKQGINRGDLFPRRDGHN